jgi:hypothetical protein
MSITRFFRDLLGVVVATLILSVIFAAAMLPALGVVQ